MNERDDRITLGTPHRGKSDDLRQLMLRYALTNINNEYNLPSRPVGPEPMLVIDTGVVYEPHDPKMTFDRMSLVDSFLELVDSLDSPLDPTLYLSQKRYSSLTEALQGKEDLDTQEARRLGATALVPLQERAQEIANGAHREYQRERLAQHQQIVCLENSLTPSS
jgi:hypothetical protein